MRYYKNNNRFFFLRGKLDIIEQFIIVFSGTLSFVNIIINSAEFEERTKKKMKLYIFTGKFE
jgi:hypothetical protein